MKLELKHLAGYLPYNLKVLSGFGEYSEIDSLYFSKDNHKRPSLNLMVSHFPKGFRGENFKDIKPILRPLSDLNKEIEETGNTYFDLLYYEFDRNGQNGFDFMYLEHKPLEYPFYIVQKLLEWHFDVFGLIENGLAISINDVCQADA